MPENYKPKYVGACNKLSEDLAEAASEDRKLLFLDEVSFTKLAILRSEWSQKNDN